jgi:hypothetical protein
MTVTHIIGNPNQFQRMDMLLQTGGWKGAGSREQGGRQTNRLLVSAAKMKYVVSTSRNKNSN